MECEKKADHEQVPQDARSDSIHRFFAARGRLNFLIVDAVEELVALVDQDVAYVVEYEGVQQRADTACEHESLRELPPGLPYFNLVTIHSFC